MLPNVTQVLTIFWVQLLGCCRQNPDKLTNSVNVFISTFVGNQIDHIDVEYGLDFMSNYDLPCTYGSNQVHVYVVFLCPSPALAQKTRC